MRNNLISEFHVDLFIRAFLVGLLRATKNGDGALFEREYNRLLGFLDYGSYAGDICEESERRIKCLVWAIRRKYYIWNW